MVSGSGPKQEDRAGGYCRTAAAIKITDSNQKNFHYRSGFRFALTSRTLASIVFQPDRCGVTRGSTLCDHVVQAEIESLRVQRLWNGVSTQARFKFEVHILRFTLMTKKMKLGIFLLAALFQFSVPALAQQTLGGITGTVVDKSGSVLPDTTVTIVGDQTQLTRAQKTNGNGAYDFVNLPIGTYTVTVNHEGFQTEKIPSILVQADRTATLNVSLKVGQVGTTIEVEAAPAMNAVDTTNGYILEQQQIQEVPLPTGSFTGLAILSPGVNAVLPNGTGVIA
jgi:hypothetical protein